MQLTLEQLVIPAGHQILLKVIFYSKVGLHAIAHNEEYRTQIPKYMLRHIVKRGITGWAQVNGCRGETDTLGKMEQRVSYNLYYIENWSLWFDIKIVFLTIFKGFVHKNAY